MSSLAKGATHIVSSPETIEKLKAMGLPIEERFISYEEYFEKLIARKRKNAIVLLKQLPLLDKSIANGVISAIYEEIRSSFALEILTSTIFNSILLLEFAMRTRLYDERLKSDPKAKWEETEKLNMEQLVRRLRHLEIIDEQDKRALNDFNEKFRNPYLHINIHKMVQCIYADNLNKVDISTSEVVRENAVNVSQHRHLWFMAKNFYDKTYVISVLNFCITWTNTLLKTKLGVS